MLPLFGRNSSSFDIYTQFYLSASPSQTRVAQFILFTIVIFTKTCRSSNWKRWTLYNCFDFVGGTIACICIPVLNEMVVYSHDTKVHGIKFRTVVLPNGLIINLEGQWEGRRHYCLLSFMNRVYKLSQLSGWHTESSKGFERKPFRVLRMIKNHWSFKNTPESLLSEPLQVAFIKNHRLKISLR